MCLRETLRLHSVVPTVTRSVEEDFEFEGILYERGTTVMVGIQAAHMDERNWKDPKTFKVRASHRISKCVAGTLQLLRYLT